METVYARTQILHIYLYPHASLCLLHVRTLCLIPVCPVFINRPSVRQRKQGKAKGQEVTNDRFSYAPPFPVSLRFVPLSSRSLSACRRRPPSMSIWLFFDLGYGRRRVVGIRTTVKSDLRAVRPTYSSGYFSLNVFTPSHAMSFMLSSKIPASLQFHPITRTY